MFAARDLNVLLVAPKRLLCKVYLLVSAMRYRHSIFTRTDAEGRIHASIGECSAPNAVRLSALPASARHMGGTRQLFVDLIVQARHPAGQLIRSNSGNKTVLLVPTSETYNDSLQRLAVVSRTKQKNVTLDTQLRKLLAGPLPLGSAVPRCPRPH